MKRDNEYCTQSYTIKAWLQFGQCMDDERNDVAHSQQANEYYNRALFSCLWKLWVEHVDGGTCYGNLGVVHCLLATLNQAKGCHDGTLIIRVKNLGIEVIQKLCIPQVFPNTWTLIVHGDLGDLKRDREIMTPFFLKVSYLIMLISRVVSSKPAAGSASFDKQVLMLSMSSSLPWFLPFVVVVVVVAVVVNVWLLRTLHVPSLWDEFTAWRNWFTNCLLPLLTFLNVGKS